MKRTKLTRILSVILILALLLTGCTTGGEVSSGTTAASTTTAATTVATSSFSPSSVKDESLSVYILKSDLTGFNCYLSNVYSFYAKNKNLFDMTITEFDEPEEMESQLRLELAAGQGPDVILADAAFGLDMMSLAENGVFYDMTDVIASDATFNNENYYLSVMEAGQIDDRQYVIPLSFTLPMFVSTTSALGEMGIDTQTDTTIEVYEKMLAYLKDSDEPQVSAFYLPTIDACQVDGFLDTAMALLSSCDKTPVLYEAGDVYLDGEEERMLIELGAELYRHYLNWKEETVLPEIPAMEMTQVPIIYSNAFTSTMQLQLYYSAYAAQGKGEEMELFFAPDENGNHRALVQEFAAVNANAQNPTLAWKFLREVIDHKTARDAFIPTSLNRDQTMSHIRQMIGAVGKANGIFRIEQVPEEYADQLIDALETVTDAEIYQLSPLTTIIKDAMNAYVNDTVTFDVMMDEINNKVKLYINE